MTKAIRFTHDDTGSADAVPGVPWEPRLPALREDTMLRHVAVLLLIAGPLACGTQEQAEDEGMMEESGMVEESGMTDESGMMHQDTMKADSSAMMDESDEMGSDEAMMEDDEGTMSDDDGTQGSP